MHAITNITKLIAESFPGAYIVPLLANHDYYPLNFTPFNKTNTTYLQNISKIWEPYISSDNMKQFLQYGYYSQIIGNNLIFIGLNTQTCYDFNFFLLSQVGDPGGQMAWFESELKKAENNS